MLSIADWMKLCRLERFTRHLVISFQLLWSFALWKLLLLLELEGEQEGGEMWPWEARSLCSQIISGLLKPLGTVSENCLLQKIKLKMTGIFPFGGLSPAAICLVWGGRGTGHGGAVHDFPHLSLHVPPQGLCGGWGLQEHPPARPKCHGAPVVLGAGPGPVCPVGVPIREGTAELRGTGNPGPGRRTQAFHLYHHYCYCYSCSYFPALFFKIH